MGGVLSEGKPFIFRYKENIKNSTHKIGQKIRELKDTRSI